MTKGSGTGTVKYPLPSWMCAGPHWRRLCGQRGLVRCGSRVTRQLIINQMTGEWDINNPALWQLNRQAAALVARIPGGVRYRWIPREEQRKSPFRAYTTRYIIT